MQRRGLLAGLTAFPIAPPTAIGAPVAVVASFSILADMTRQIAGDSAQVISLVPPDGDPHVYQPTAADSRALNRAAVLVENGLGLEGWIARLSHAAGFAGVRAVASEGVAPRRIGGGMVDPHAWQDPRNGSVYIKNIAASLIAADPPRQELYRAAAARFAAGIEATDAWIAAQFAAIPPTARRIVTTHDAFGYYGDRYGVTFLAAEGLATDAEPSARAIAALVAQIKREKIRAVFLENMADPRIAAMLASETGAVLSGPVFADALSPPGGKAPDYLAMLRHNTALFVRALGPA